MFLPLLTTNTVVGTQKRPISGSNKQMVPLTLTMSQTNKHQSKSVKYQCPQIELRQEKYGI